MSAMRWSRALQLSSGLSSVTFYNAPLVLSQACLATFAPTIASARHLTSTPHNSFSTWVKEPWLCPATVPTLRALHSSAQSEPLLNYKISASYSAKQDKLDPEGNVYSHDPFTQEKRMVKGSNGQSDKLSRKNRPKSGQDSFFVAQVGSSGSTAFGVVDGVGGWAESGIDPANFAHSLCDYMAVAANGYPKGFPKGPLHPKELLQVGFENVTKDDEVEAGGSTACIGVLEPKGQLEVANLGDSGFVHLGLNAVRYVSEPQTHAFNTPYQMSKLPKQMRLFGGALADLPRDSNVTTHHLSHGDVVVFASDGVWDNLSPQDALSIVSRYMLDLGAWTDTKNGIRVGEQFSSLTEQGGLAKSNANTLQSVLAIAITKEAKEASLNTRRDGPFAREVQKYYPGERWHGGKPDDICVVVIVAVNA